MKGIQRRILLIDLCEFISITFDSSRDKYKRFMHVIFCRRQNVAYFQLLIDFYN